MSKAMMQALTTPGLNQTERNIYAYLVGRANGARMCWPLIAEIQTDLGIGSRHTVCDATGRLAGMGLIKVKRHMRARNDYLILDPGGRLYGDDPDGRGGARLNGHATPVRPAEKAAKSDISTDLSTDHDSDVQSAAHQTPQMCNQVHIRPPGECAKSCTSDVQNSAQESSFKNPSRLKKEGAIAHDLKGKASQPASQAAADEVPQTSLAGLPPGIAAAAHRVRACGTRAPDAVNIEGMGGSKMVEDRMPTTAEIMAKRAEHAMTLAALPTPLADALATLSRRVGRVALAPGCRPERSREEQIAATTVRPGVRPNYLSGEHLAAARARAMPAGAAP